MNAGNLTSTSVSRELGQADASPYGWSETVVSTWMIRADVARNLLRVVCPRGILNHMVHYQRQHLDASFAALSDATRRGILERLGRADASITELAGTFQMTLTGMKKHISVLEQTGLVTTEKSGRVRTCKLGPRQLEEVAAWIESYRQLWQARFDELDKIIEEIERTEKGHSPQTRT